MADIKTTVLTVDTGGAITNVKEFKQHIEDLKGKLLGLEKGTEEYNTVAKELKNSQQKLNEVMDVAKGKGEAVEGSYDNLVKTMSELKKQWRATADETERAKLGEQILSINNQLKDLDASTGNFQRNVGDYANAFTTAFDEVSKSIGSSIPAVGKLNNAFKLLTTNPVLAFLGAITTAIMAVVNAIKNSETQLNKFKVAVAPVKVVIDGIKNAFSALAEKVVSGVETIMNNVMKAVKWFGGIARKLGLDELADKVDAFVAKTEEYVEAEQKAVDITAKRRKINEDIAKTENKIADLRAKIADKTKYSEDERLKFVEEWEKAEKHRAQLAIDLAQEEYDIIKWRNEQTESGTKDLDAESDAYVNLINAQGEYSQAMIRVNKQKSNLLKEISSQEKEEAKETKEQAQNDIKELVNTTKKTINEIKKVFDTEIIKLNFQFDLSNLKKDTKNAKGGLSGLFSDFKAYPDILKMDDIEAELKKTLDYNNAVLELKKNANNAIIEENELLLQSLPEGSQEALNALNMISEAKKGILEAETETTLSNLEAQNNAEEKMAARRKQRQEVLLDGLTTIAGLFDMVAKHQHAQIQQDYKDGKISEATAKKRFEDTKKMQIASAIVNMAAGVVSAISQAQQLGPIAGPIAAAVNAAAVITAGAIQIAEISKTKFGDSAANTTTPNVAEVSNDFTPTYVENPTGNSELTNLSNAINNKPTYVSVTDINDVQNKVQVREKETTY